MAKILLQILLLSIIFKINAQTINIYSISTARQTGGDKGYTLDGLRMIGSRAKLLEPANFGTSGVYPKNISITDSYSTTGSLTQVGTIPINSIFFFGSFNLLDASTSIFTPAEKDSLYNWSIRGGKLIIAESPTVIGQYNSEILNSKWNFSLNFSSPSYFLPTNYGNSTDIFNGPFGFVPSAYQGGSDQGYFNSIPSNTKVLATDANGNTTLYLDCNTLDLVIADVDGYTDLGGISNGVGISSYQDRFWVNTITFMDQLENPPVIIKNSIELSTGVYNAYQWLINGNPITGANGQLYSVIENGTYSVQTTLKCGCILMSDTVVIDTIEPTLPITNNIFLPSMFSPNGDGANDVFRVRGSNIAEGYLTIYNRWGEKVWDFKFQNSDLKNAAKWWDGTYKGQPLNTAVFVYFLKVTYEDGKTEEKKGNITLVR